MILFINLLVENGNKVVVGVNERDPGRLTDLVLLRIVDGEDDRHRHVNDRPVFESERVKMKSLEELGFSHESTEGAGPPLAQHMDPLHVDPGELDFRKRSRLSPLRRPL